MASISEAAWGPMALHASQHTAQTWASISMGLTWDEAQKGQAAGWSMGTPCVMECGIADEFDPAAG